MLVGLVWPSLINGSRAVSTTFTFCRDPVRLNAQWQGWESDYSDESLAQIAESIAEAPGELARLVITNGVLQGEGFRPERALRQLARSAMRQIFEVNTMLPMVALGAFESQLKQAEKPRVAVSVCPGR